MIVSSLYWNYHNEEENVKALALNVVKSSIKKDIRLRQWAAKHGGVYVPVSKHAQPNPYLQNVPHREIVGDNNKTYTLIHPAHMLRLTLQDYKDIYGIKGSLTSLNVLNPSNASDEWERKALLKFEDKNYKAPDYYEFFKEGEPILKYMRGLKVKQNCLKCHAHQGYEVGDNRGGMSVTIPMTEFYASAQEKLDTITIWHFFIWLFMTVFMFIIYFFMRRNLMRLEELTRHEQRVNQLKDEFLMNLSHEVRTPLNAIEGFSTVLGLRLEDEKLKGHVEGIRQGSKAIMSLMDNLVQLAQLKSDSYKIRPEPVVLSEVMQTKLESFKPMAEEKGIEYSYIIDDNIDKNIECDVNVINKITENLVENAIKFTQSPGEVKVKVIYNDYSHELSISVEDNGIGISDEEQERIFDLFYQVDGSTVRMQDGLGIGLTMVKKLVERLNGSIKLQSYPDEGTYVKVTVKMQSV